MMTPRVPFAVLAVFVTLVGISLPGCAPRRIGASSQSFYGSGLADFSIEVAKPLTLAASGRQSAQAPTDDTILPASATVAWSVFTDKDSGPVERHAHILFSELPRDAWRWEMETWAKHESLSYASEEKAGKYWTIQIFPVVDDADWFSLFWQANGREAPRFWLAKRWSSTPEKEMRLLAEYREPAPACMQERLAAAAQRDAPLMDGKALWRGCEQEVDAFSARANGVFTMGKMPASPDRPITNKVVLPQKRMNMLKLAGRAEAVNQLSKSGD